MAGPKNPDIPQLSQGLWGGVTIVAVLSLVAYSYSLAYLFRIEPQFVSAFSPVDLILWAASSLYIILAAAAALATGSLVYAAGSLREARPKTKDKDKPPANPPWWSRPRTYVASVAVLVAIAFIFGSYQGWRTHQSNAKPRAWVCGDVENSPTCYPLVFMGSEKLVFAADGKFILRKIADRHRVVAQGTPPYFPPRQDPLSSLINQQ